MGVERPFNPPHFRVDVQLPNNKMAQIKMAISGNVFIAYKRCIRVESDYF